ncbi:PREDICTED: plant intracellular Ras-group-related LRR protein 5-like isoform X2 [Lupinus angustifolius]|uniref:plant intracellular Ras-group-related LRR protein 5-like isoform X2 n=1 Tax=Lupinus angustifolius TaxID=3871 RepID=UPI00092EBCB0|nr:PREDICTED: plant intracellular Ras-group-related LRR protein 5-like isoform X2 [Lupinus angustifolius]
MAGSTTLKSDKDPSSSSQPPSRAFLNTVQEITSLYSSLPPRPSIHEVEAATCIVDTVNNEEQTKLQELSMQKPPHDVPHNLFSVLQQLKKTLVMFQCYEQRKEALHVVQLEKMFHTFGDLIQKASVLVSGDTQINKFSTLVDPFEKIERDVVIVDEILVKKKEEEQEKNDFEAERGSSVKGFLSSGYESCEKLSLMKVATLLENFANNGATTLELRGKLVDQMEWLPLSIGKLSEVTEIDLSENRIMALPITIEGLKALTKLDLHSNQLINLPNSFGELISLTHLDLHANRLKSLPASFGNLINLIDLDLSSNVFTHLPETIGSLSSLKILNVETNQLEELPYTIGNCSSLSVLKLDFNELKAFPEAIGKLELLEVLTLHYNRVKRLPSTVGNLCNLKELDISFNELEFVPENLCFAVNLKKLNLANNFADLRALPKSIGNLEMLEELDISDDQIRALPESFRFLSKLRVFRADETPLEMPPKEVVKLGAQEVVQYMADFATRSDAKILPSKKKNKKGFWFWFCSIFCPQQIR